MDVWNFEIEITLKRSHGNNGWSLCFSLGTEVKMCVIIKWFKLDLVTSSVKQSNGKECLLYRFLCILFYNKWTIENKYRKQVHLLN